MTVLEDLYYIPQKKPFVKNFFGLTTDKNIMNEKMKKQLIPIILLLAATSSFAEVAKMRFKLTESTDEFNINYIETPDMTLIESKEKPDVAVTRTYKIKKRR